MMSFAALSALLATATVWVLAGAVNGPFTLQSAGVVPGIVPSNSQMRPVESHVCVPAADVADENDLPESANCCTSLCRSQTSPVTASTNSVYAAACPLLWLSSTIDSYAG